MCDNIFSTTHREAPEGDVTHRVAAILADFKPEDEPVGASIPTIPGPRGWDTRLVGGKATCAENEKDRIHLDR
jgi:hypothetical protein